MRTMTQVFLADAIFAEGQLHRNRPLFVDADGRVGATSSSAAERIALPGRLILPGFVNAHSHAFQRMLRGRTEFLAAGHVQDDFWSWREAMYVAANSLSPDDVYAVCLQSFVEMALAGITSVGEFHYLHHGPDGTPYANEHELAEQVIRAARDAGLRIVLLRVVYGRAGFDVAANPRQRRFIDGSIESSLRRTADLTARFASAPMVSIGLAPHSVRAVPRAWLEVIGREWLNGPLHIHVSEQPAEIVASLAEHGRRPVELLHDCGVLRPGTTGVHAIHLSDAEVQLLASTKAAVCACPSTERNLGDGIVAADHLLNAGVSLSLGSDSQAHIGHLEEAQQLEGHLRLVRGRRNVLDTAEGSVDGLARRLLATTSAAGAKSLGLNTGSLRPREVADFVTIDLRHPSLVGAENALLPSVVFGGSSAAVRDVVVNGRFVVRDGVHPLTQTAAEGFVDVIRRVF
jgi:formimidoylglutamate deiminase